MKGHAAPRGAVVERDCKLLDVSLFEDAFLYGTLFKVWKNLVHPTESLFQRTVGRTLQTKWISGGECILQIFVEGRIGLGAACGEVLVGAVKIVDRQANILEVVFALGSPSRLACRLDRW